MRTIRAIIAIAVALWCAPNWAPATPFGDVDASGQVDAVDVQLVVNSALNMSVAFATDLNGDTVTDAVDVQLVVNAALGVSITPPGTVSGQYDPLAGLHLATNGVDLTIPAGAVAGPVTITMKKFAATDAPAPIPGGLSLLGAVFGPDGQVFSVPASVSLTLPSATPARALPVLTYDSGKGAWVGTGEVATIASNGMDVQFPVNHFSIAGIPDAVPIPSPGDPVGNFVVLSNNGALNTEAISSTEAALLYSAFGTTFSISANSQTINDHGQIETHAIGLSAIQIYTIDNYVVGVVGGATSLYNDGTTNEPAVGVMIMSVSGTAVNVSLYVATPDRVIQGTLTGTI